LKREKGKEENKFFMAFFSNGDSSEQNNTEGISN